ncbi:MAG: hypothetical protein ACJ8FB_04020, partial [Sphingomicrobium sp.]
LRVETSSARPTGAKRPDRRHGITPVTAGRPVALSDRVAKQRAHNPTVLESALGGKLTLGGSAGYLSN